MIYDFQVSILKSYISWMVGPIFNLFFLKCSSFNSEYILLTILARDQLLRAAE